MYNDDTQTADYQQKNRNPVKGFKEGAEKLGKKAENFGRETVDKLYHAASEAGETIKHEAERLKDKTTEISKELTHTVSEYVKHKPITSIAIAGAVGVLLGIIIRR